MNSFEWLQLVQAPLRPLEPSTVGLAVLLVVFALLGIMPLFPFRSTINKAIVRAASGQPSRPAAVDLASPTCQIVTVLIVFVIAYKIATPELVTEYSSLELYDRMTVVHHQEKYRDEYLNSLFLVRPLTKEFKRDLRESRRTHPNIPWHFVLNAKYDSEEMTLDNVITRPQDAIGPSRNVAVLYGDSRSAAPDPDSLNGRLDHWLRFFKRTPLLNVPKHFWPDELLTDLDRSMKGE